ncbi:hypothetical protein OsJ_31040 [Oryza sativa Japonica Group]|uniref:Uncharacterized protein n=1 Tax=Oryza sativa subsp. japonica TaxID=39947 RepID=B9G7Z6_ORYSJ|nr:hypothetical protein OsJ_31040 [Oryza sativa Japonica Group]
MRVILHPATRHPGGTHVDGFVQSAGRRATVVHARPGQRGYADVGAFQGTPQPPLRAPAPLRAAIRALGVPPHEHRGRLPRSVPGPASPRRSSRGSPAGTAVHRGPPPAAQPPGPAAEAGIPGRGHESRPTVRAHGALPVPGHDIRARRTPDAGPPAIDRPRRQAGTGHRHRRGSPGQAALPSPAGGAPSPRAVLQL